jgi:hypothetical protein
MLFCRDGRIVPTDPPGANPGRFSGLFQGLLGLSSCPEPYSEQGAQVIGSIGIGFLVLTRWPVLDLVFVGVSVLFFVVSIGYVAACDRLMK